MRFWPYCSLMMALWGGASPQAGALGLLEGYRQLLNNDPTLLAAKYENEAGHQETKIGRAGLLPQVALTGSKSRVHGTEEQPGCIQSGFFGCQAIGNTKQYLSYASSNASLTLRQPIFNLATWYQYQQGKARASYSDAVYEGKQKEAATRYLEAYLSVLLAQENIDLATKQVEALKGQLALAQRSFTGGEAPITDVDDAQARLDLAEAQRIEAQNQLGVNLKKLGDLTGQTPNELRAPGPAMPLERPQPNLASAWLDLAREQSPEVHAGRQAVEIAKREVQKTRAQYSPTVDFFVEADKSRSQSVATLNQYISTRAAGVQVNIPIFNGGLTTAQSSQAAARYEQAQSELDATLQKVGEDVVTQYSGVVNGVSKVQALRRAVASNEKALVSNKMGYKGGVRTSVDILNAEQQLYQAKRDLAQATYTYLLSWVQLKADVGLLGEEDIAALDRVFTVDRPTIASE